MSFVSTVTAATAGLSERVDWKKAEPADGLPPLVPAVVQDAADGRVLMLGYMSRESLDETLRLREVVFFSRSRRELWRKGATSGNVLDLISIEADCDADALLVRARPRGPACHTGAASCFATAEPSILQRLDALIEERAREPQPGSYTSSLFASGLDRIAQKVGEEAVEAVIAAKNADDDAFVGEAADLLFHLLVLIRARGMQAADVLGRLEARSGRR